MVRWKASNAPLVRLEMGVQGLWELLSPVGLRVSNSHVRHKRMAVDASIWLTQFVRAMRESEGAMLPNAHLIGIFRRCCKLLFLGVKPVLVFDGATPALKRRTRDLRRAQRDRDVAKLRRLAERLLLNQMRSAAVNAVAGASRKPGRVAGARISKRRRLGSLSPPKEMTSTRTMLPGPGYDPFLDDLVVADEEQAGEADRDEDLVYQEPELRIELPDDLHEIDDEALANLPPNVQAEVFKQIRQAQRAHHRAQVMTRQSDPAEFSKAQIVGFMKNTALNRRIKSVRKAINSKSGANQRIASDSKRMYLLEEGDGVDDDLNPESSDSDGGAVPVRDVSPENQELDLLTRIRIQRERRQASHTGDEPVSSGARENAVPKDFGLGWASKVLHTGGHHKLGATVEDDVVDRDESSDEDVPLVAVKKSIEQRSIPNRKMNVESDSDGSMEWEDGATSASVPPATSSVSRNAEERDEYQVREAEGNQENPPGELNEKRISDGVEEKETPGKEAKSSKIGEDDVQWGESLEKNANDAELSATVARIDVEEDVDLQKAIILSIESSQRSTSERNPPVLVADEIRPQVVARTPLRDKEEAQVTAGKAAKHNVAENVNESAACAPPQYSSLVNRAVFGEPSQQPCDSQPTLENAVNAPSRSDFLREVREPTDVEEHEKEIRANEIDSDFREKGRDDVVSAFQEAVLSSDAKRNQAPEDKEDRDLIADQEVGDRFVATPIAVEEDDQIEKRWNKRKTVDEQQENELKEDVDIIEKDIISEIEKDKPEMPDSDVFEDDPTIRATIEKFVNDSEDHQLNEANIAAAENILNAKENEKSTEAKLSQLDLLHEAEMERLRADLEFERADLVRKQHQQRKVVESVTEEMIAETRDLLRLFGIPFLEAPMEAEAQCAFLNLKGLVDGVITEDSDAFLFGASTVYRRLFLEGKFAEAYDASTIKSELGIDREQLIKLAYLLGSDYTPGVRGIGIVNSMEVLEAFPGMKGLIELLEWTKSVTILDEEPDEETMQSKEHQAVRRQFCWKHRNVKRNWIFHPGFPNPQVAEAYWKPLVNTSEEPFSWKPVDFSALEQFCYKKFGWDSERFNDAIGPLRQELRERENRGPDQRRIEEFFKPHRFAKIKSERLQRAVQGIAGENAGKLMASPKKKSCKLE